MYVGIQIYHTYLCSHPYSRARAHTHSYTLRAHDDWHRHRHRHAQIHAEHTQNAHRTRARTSTHTSTHPHARSLTPPHTGTHKYTRTHARPPAHTQARIFVCTMCVYQHVCVYTHRSRAVCVNTTLRRCRHPISDRTSQQDIQSDILNRRLISDRTFKKDVWFQIGQWSDNEVRSQKRGDVRSPKTWKKWGENRLAMRRANLGSDVEDLEKNTKMGKRFQRSEGTRHSVAARRVARATTR